MALKTIRITKEEMNSRVARFDQLKGFDGGRQYLGFKILHMRLRDGKMQQSQNSVLFNRQLDLGTVGEGTD